MIGLPGLIDAHSHLLLHPYNETPWDDQVLKETLAERVCRATNHAKANLLSGFTTLRDLGHMADGDEVVVVASLPVRATGSTNFLKLHRVGESKAY